MTIPSKFNRWVFIIIGLLLLGLGGFWAFKKFNFNNYIIGQAVDSFNGVKIYYNGWVSHDSGRNVSKDGYNLGLKYQCVEFVKRYYYEHLNHKMPNSLGHAKDFFNCTLKDGAKNVSRNLTQYSNPSKSRPMVDDLVVFSGTTGNPFGHVAIISKVTDYYIEIVQQNPGSFAKSQINLYMQKQNGKCRVN